MTETTDPAEYGDAVLRQRAAAEHIPTSALVRRLLRQALRQASATLSLADVEDIARRTAREELQHQGATSTSSTIGGGP